MSLDNYFVEYLAEEKGETVIVTDKGWASYRIFEHTGRAEKEIMICEMYVAPKYRGTQEAVRMSDEISEIGRKSGCSHLSCFVQKKNDTDHERRRMSYKLRIFLKYGFLLHSMNEHQLVLTKDL